MFYLCQGGEKGEKGRVEKGEQQQDLTPFLNLLAQGVNLNYHHPHHHSTPLITATKQNNIIIMLLLILNGADLKGVDDRGWTALHYAAFFNYVTAVKVGDIDLNRCIYYICILVHKHLFIYNLYFSLSLF